MTTCSPNCPVVKQQLRQLVEQSPWLQEKYGRKPGQASTSATASTLQEVATATSASLIKGKKGKKDRRDESEGGTPWEDFEGGKAREEFEGRKSREKFGGGKSREKFGGGKSEEEFEGGKSREESPTGTKRRTDSPHSRGTNESRSVSRDRSVTGKESRSTARGKYSEGESDRESYLNLQESRSHQSYPDDARYTDSQHSSRRGHRDYSDDESIELRKSEFSLDDGELGSEASSKRKKRPKDGESDSEYYADSVKSGGRYFTTPSFDISQKGRGTMGDSGSAGPSGRGKSSLSGKQGDPASKTGHSKSQDTSPSPGKNRSRGTGEAMTEDELCELEEECDFDNVCLCRMHCVIRGMRKYTFVRSMLTAVVLFTIGLKLCSELDAWTLPTRAV